MFFEYLHVLKVFFSDDIIPKKKVKNKELSNCICMCSELFFEPASYIDKIQIHLTFF